MNTQLQYQRKLKKLKRKRQDEIQMMQAAD